MTMEKNRGLLPPRLHLYSVEHLTSDGIVLNIIILCHCIVLRSLLVVHMTHHFSTQAPSLRMRPPYLSRGYRKRNLFNLSDSTDETSLEQEIVQHCYSIGSVTNPPIHILYSLP